MKTYVAAGDIIEVAAPYNVASGVGALVGSLFGVAQNTALSGASVPLAVTGVYDLVKTGAQAWTVGARIYWDDSAKACTTTASTNKLIGVAVLAVGSGAGETTGRVRLSGAFTI